MRLFVFFDLPTDTSKDKKNYRLFRKYLIKEGYIMQQFSIYSKLIVNDKEINSEIEKLKTNKPPSGLVQTLTVTEKQFSNMVYITGQKTNEVHLDNSDNLVIIC